MIDEGVSRNTVTGTMPILGERQRNKVSVHFTSDSFSPLSRRTFAAKS